MILNSTLAVAVVATAGGILLVAWLGIAWQRGSKAQAELRDRRAAQRSRYSLAADVQTAAARTPLKSKQEFGRR